MRNASSALTAAAAILGGIGLYTLVNELAIWLKRRRVQRGGKGKGGGGREPALPRFSTDALRDLLDGDSLEARREIRAYLSEFDDLFSVNVEESSSTVAEQRDLALTRAQLFLKSGLVSVQHILSDPLRFIAAHELFLYTDPSAVYLMSVQLNLFGGSILKLGTERHTGYLASVDKWENIGCFALTEFRHGVNSGINLDTTATYDKSAQEFELHTPSAGAQKHWIVLLARHATMAIVFARLLIPQEGGAAPKDEGVHAFLIRVRDDKTKAPLPGIRIEDMGIKSSLEGCDTGRLFLHKVRVPRTALLNRYSDVAEDGSYTSTIPSPRERFLKVADQLMSGRMCIAASSVNAAKLAILLAVRYACARMQDVQERGVVRTVNLFTHLTHRRALLPAIARTVANGLYINYVKQRYATRTDKDSEEVLRMVCMAKAVSTTDTVAIARTCTDACGGQGFLAGNRLAELNNVASTLVVVEGDAMLLAQKVVGELLKEASSGNPVVVYMSNLVKTAAIGLKVRTLSTDVTSASFQHTLLSARLTLRLIHLQNLLFAGKSSKENLRTYWSQVCLQDVIDTNRAAHELRAFERLQQQIKANKDSTVLPLLLRLGELYAIECISRDLGWFMSNLPLCRFTARLVPERLDTLCRSFTDDDVLDIVASFGVPDAMLKNVPVASQLWQTICD